MAGSYTYLRCEHWQRVLKVTIQREEKLNAMNAAMMEEITACFRQIKGVRDIGAVVLTGVGKAFMAGADIEGYDALDAMQFSDFQEKGRDMYRAIEVCDKPVIAAVNGYALGGGFELALACDLIIASEKAKFGLPEVKLGLIPGGGGVQKLLRIAGPYLARELLMSGRFIEAREGKELRFVNRIEAPDKLAEAAMALARDIAEKAPLAVQALKRLIREGRDAGMETAYSYDRAILANLSQTEDAKEGISAFVEKRAPQFRGN